MKLELKYQYSCRLNNGHDDILFRFPIVTFTQRQLIINFQLGNKIWKILLEKIICWTWSVCMYVWLTLPAPLISGVVSFEERAWISDSENLEGRKYRYTTKVWAQTVALISASSWFQEYPFTSRFEATLFHGTSFVNIDYKRNVMSCHVGNYFPYLLSKRVGVAVQEHTTRLGGQTIISIIRVCEAFPLFSKLLFTIEFSERTFAEESAILMAMHHGKTSRPNLGKSDEDRFKFPNLVIARKFELFLSFWYVSTSAKKIEYWILSSGIRHLTCVYHRGRPCAMRHVYVCVE